MKSGFEPREYYRKCVLSHYAILCEFILVLILAKTNKIFKRWTFLRDEGKLHFKGNFFIPTSQDYLGMVGLVGISSSVQSPHSLPVPYSGGDMLPHLCSSLHSSLTSCSSAGAPAPGLQVCTSSNIHLGPMWLLWFSCLAKDSGSLYSLKDWPVQPLLSQRIYQKTHKNLSPERVRPTFQPSAQLSAFFLSFL